MKLERWTGCWSLCLLLLIVSGFADARDVPHAITAQGTIEVAFTPEDDAESMVIAAIARARGQILVQAYSFSSWRIANALIAAKARGVEVRVLADRDQLFGVDRNVDTTVVDGRERGNSNSRIPELAAAGIPVMLEVRYAAAHNKVMVIDAGLPEAAVVTGSYNWTYSAQRRNAENVMILRGNPQLVHVYQQNWLRHQAEALPYTGSR